MLRETPETFERPQPANRPLDELAQTFQLVFHNKATETNIHGISVSTASLYPGDLFVALKGHNIHGAERALQAQNDGAAAILTDHEGVALIPDTVTIPVLVAENPRALVGDIAAWIYRTGRPDYQPTLFGVTGTNGKTSTSYFLIGLLKQLGFTTGLSSTAERVIGEKTVLSDLTTPEASEVHALLGLMKAQQVQAVALEISAQAPSQHRVDGILFDVASFTNFSHDHLDFYDSLEQYFQAKLELFTPEKSRQALISLDSAYGFEVVKHSSIPTQTIAVPSIADQQELATQADWIVDIVSADLNGTTITVTGPQQQTLTTRIPVVGSHMASNAAIAIVSIALSGVPWEDIAAVLLRDGELKAHIPGRLEKVSGVAAPAVFVDFGHSPDAIAKTLDALRAVTPGKVVSLLGADGERDPSKRPDMGKAAAEGSDTVIITDINPRFEDPQAIRTSLLNGAASANSDATIIEIAGPEKAVVEAVALLEEQDCLVWFGHGHEDYYDVLGKKLAFSARELARRALKGQGWEVPDSNWVVPYPPEEE